MSDPPYTVVPHLDFYRIIGLAGHTLVTFKEKAQADEVCLMLVAAYRQGADAKLKAIREALEITGGRR